MQPKMTGMLLCIGGVTLLSPDVLVMRWVALDHATLLLWRGIFLTVGFGAVVLLRYRRDCLRALTHAGWLGVASGLCFALNTTCYTQALQRTSATAAMMIISTAPVFAALVSWLMLGERISRKTAVAICATLVGIGIIAADAGGQNDLLGNLFAMGTAIFMAINFTLARLKSHVDLTPGLVFGGLMAALFALLEGRPAPSPALADLGAMALTAAISMPVGFTLLQIAPRYISATDVSLFLLLEAVLGPLWVWLVLDEVPGGGTVAGSAVIFAALAWYGAPGRRGRRRGLRAPVC